MLMSLLCLYAHLCHTYCIVVVISLASYLSSHRSSMSSQCHWCHFYAHVLSCLCTPLSYLLFSCSHIVSVLFVISPFIIVISMPVMHCYAYAIIVTSMHTYTYCIGAVASLASLSFHCPSLLSQCHLYVMSLLIIHCPVSKEVSEMSIWIITIIGGWKRWQR